MRPTRWVWFVTCLALVGACRTHPAEGQSHSPFWAGVGARAGKVIELDLSGGVPESSASGGLLPLPARRTYLGLIRAIARAAADPRVTGVYLSLGSTGLGWGRTEELSRLLSELRARSRTIVCHADHLDNASVWLVLAGCDRIWLSPAGTVDAVGIAAQVLYLRGALDKLKVRADILAIGKYKSAAEPLTREGPSDEARESLTETLASLRSTWLEGVENRRQRSGLRQVVEQGPWSVEEAKARGLVDAIGYESEARADAEQRGRARRTTPEFGPRAGGERPGLVDLVRILAGADQSGAGRPRIALVPAEGAISLRSGGLPAGGGIVAESLVKTLRKLRDDDTVRAVVVRIDSPGGSALASDLLWHELMELREKKPVVASVGDMAASGGYYLASAAQRIVAGRTSIVGSIGVVGGKLVLEETLAALGIRAVTFPASSEPGAVSRAGHESPLVPWDDSTRDRIRSQMLAVYNLFVRRVAEGRGKSEAEIRRLAEGRIYSGAQAKERGLVDEIGGLSRALELARELGGLEEQAPVTIAAPPSSLLEVLLLDDENRGRITQWFRRPVASPSGWLEPFLPRRVETFVAGLLPLANGEHTATALPFALLIE